MQPKPAHLAPEYGAQFRDHQVVRAYPTRPPYPEEVIDRLCALLPDADAVVLDLGCGAGDIARRMAPRVARVDAVDPSTAMLELGRTLPGGSLATLRWIESTAEEFDYETGYGLIVAAQSFHWMDWQRVIPKIRGALAPEGQFAIIRERRLLGVPWEDELRSLIPRHSTNRDYRPYDLLHELALRDLFVPEQVITTAPVPFAQSVADYIESFHSRNGLARSRMEDGGAEFDRELLEIVQRYTSENTMEFEVVADVAWGRP